MIHESIKTLLGQEMAAQVEEALKGKGKNGADVDLVVGNDGSYVPNDKHESVKAQVISAEKALKSAAEALKSVGGSGDPAKIAEDVKAAQSTIDTLQETHQSEIKALQKNTALRMALAGQVHDPADIIGTLDLAGIEVDENGNLRSDLDAILKPLRESKAYLFKQEADDPLDIKGARPADPGAPPKDDGPAKPVIF